ncbi:cis-3-hydroxy-L-proline dehydratase [Mesorhizobium sp. PL10]
MLSPAGSTALVRGNAAGEILFSDMPLSFWGGVKSETGEVIDRHHPLSGQLLTNKILAIPSSRGSCTGSAVILELLLNDRGPAAILLERPEDIITLGVIVAEEVFGKSIPVVCVGSDNFRALAAHRYADVSGTRVKCLSAFEACAPQDGGQVPDEPAARIELTEGDERIAAGALGKAAQVAMKIIVRMAELQGAACLRDISQAHIDGCGYTGPGGLQFATKLLDWGAQVVIPTTLNAISVDQLRWSAQGIEPSFGEAASRLADTYVKMGAKSTFTCAPYLLESAPKKGDQIVWAESNAVVYANSVLGARTMKYPDYLDICVALTGRAPSAGCHLDENRHAAIQIDLFEIEEADDALYPLLGYCVGMIAGADIPVIEGLSHHKPTSDDLKAFGAAFATTSGAPMFHMVGVTPEASSLAEATGNSAPARAIKVCRSDLARCWEELNGAQADAIDLVALGSPHFSFDEFVKLASLCRGRSKREGIVVIATCARATLEKVRDVGLAPELEQFGVQFVTDTCWCMIVEPVVPPSVKVIMTNSAKYAHYGPGLLGKRMRFGSLASCVEAACSGQMTNILPLWLRDPP